jgi:hypothetical protein
VKTFARNFAPFWIGGLLGLFVVSLFYAAHPADGATQSVIQCPVAANPCAGYQDNTTDHVVTIFTLNDHSGIPECWLSNAGGWKCTDRITTMLPGSMSEPSAYLDNDGHVWARYGVYVGNYMLTPHDVDFLHCLESFGQTAASCRKNASVTP